MAAKALSPAAIVDVAELGACHGVTTAYFNGQCIGVVNDPKFYPNLGVNMPAGAAWAVSSFNAYEQQRLYEAVANAKPIEISGQWWRVRPERPSIPRKSRKKRRRRS